MIELAREKAANLPYLSGNQRVYAIISDKKGNLLSEGHNDYSKSSPHMKKYSDEVGLYGKIYWHAECRAVHYLPKNKKAYKISIARVNKLGEFLPSKPCPVCENAIKKAGINIVECVI
jgi:tRNA(Arg) A34 adenosine deaminase TadA